MTILKGDSGSICILTYDRATYDEWLNIYPDGKIMFHRNNYSKRKDESWPITINDVRNYYPCYYNAVTHILQQFKQSKTRGVI